VAQFRFYRDHDGTVWRQNQRDMSTDVWWPGTQTWHSAVMSPFSTTPLADGEAQGLLGAGADLFAPSDTAITG
jgi:hypothetical protein